jgi:hypothetical protein
MLASVGADMLEAISRSSVSLSGDSTKMTSAPCLGVRAAAPDGFRQAVVGACVGSRDDQRLGVEPVVDGGPQALLHFLDRHDFAAGFVTAFLGAGSILELHRAGAGRFELAHRPAHHDHAAVSDIGIGDQRHGRHGAQTANPLGHLGERDQPHIGKSEHRRGLSVTGHVDRLESGLLDQQRRERVVGASRGHDLAALDQSLQRVRGPIALFRRTSSEFYALRLRAIP